MRKFIVAFLIAASAAVLGAQDLQLYVGPTTDADIRWAKASDFNGSILFCRGFYEPSRYEGGGTGWWTDYPGADNNFLVRLSELTKVRVRLDKDNRMPFYVVVGLDDDLLFKCPILFMEDVGTASFTTKQVDYLRRYFLKGGFLWVDDFWGSAAWDQWETNIRKVLPADRFKMIDIPADHPIFHQLYDIKGGIWQQSNVSVWTGTSCPDVGILDDADAPEYWARNQVGCGPGTTSERGRDSAEPHFRGILDEKGRLIIVMTHNTDIADSWEEEKPENQEYIQAFSAKGYALGIDIWIYALTH